MTTKPLCAQWRARRDVAELFSEMEAERQPSKLQIDLWLKDAKTLNDVTLRDRATDMEPDYTLARLLHTGIHHALSGITDTAEKKTLLARQAEIVKGFVIAAKTPKVAALEQIYDGDPMPENPDVFHIMTNTGNRDAVDRVAYGLPPSYDPADVRADKAFWQDLGTKLSGNALPADKAVAAKAIAPPTKKS